VKVLQLNWLEIQDFGPFQGKQRIDFAPPENGKPITLIGGLNGAGKTTLLEAILFVLHGKNAPTQKRSRNSYSDYLTAMVNRYSESEEAAVTFSFDSIENGVATSWEVTRYILKKKVKHQESLQVSINGHVDSIAATRWPFEVESLWPRHLSNILFFDGERLKELASPEVTSAALKQAMKLLLGGLPVSKATSDLKELEKRIIAREDLSEADRARLDESRDEVKRVRDEVTQLVREQASLRVRHDTAMKHRDNLSKEFTAHGGELVGQLTELKAEKSALEKEQISLHGNLIELAGGLLPLAILKKNLAKLADNVDQEVKQSKNKDISEYLKKRDKSFLKFFVKELRGGDLELRQIEEWLDENRPLSPDSLEVIHEPGLANELSVLSELLPDITSQAKKIALRASQVSSRLSEIDRLSHELPGEDDVITMKENLLLAEAKESHLLKELEKFEQLISQKRTNLERLEQSEQIIIKKVSKSLDKEAAGARVLEKLPELIEFFKSYENDMLLNSISDMEERIFKCFSSMFKKQMLIQKLTIDPKSFEISLFDGGNERIGIDRLSAGERQMLATSIIWALGQLSENAAPVIIDTPVGRLDSDYRAMFIGNYLPMAANQVVVLSTDEEINETYYPLIESTTGAEYELSFDNAAQTSLIKKGYPFKSKIRDESNETGRAAA
jgi:DNA sulfur modification protein DndD